MAEQPNTAPRPVQSLLRVCEQVTDRVTAVVLGMAGYTLKRNEHLRIDIFRHRLGERGMAWLGLAGFVLFLLPMCLGAVPFLLIQLAMVALLVVFPGLVTTERTAEDAATSDLELKIPTSFELEQAGEPPEPAEEASR